MPALSPARRRLGALAVALLLDTAFGDQIAIPMEHNRRDHPRRHRSAPEVRLSR
jgi:hypothetical protein